VQSDGFVWGREGFTDGGQWAEFARAAQMRLAFRFNIKAQSLDFNKQNIDYTI
jgi:hypothetical protein